MSTAPTRTTVADYNESLSCNDSCYCFDHRYPSYNTVTPCPFTRRGFLPAGSYMFSEEGAVYDYCKGKVLPKNYLSASTGGPLYGATMGACVPRAVQSDVNDLAGSFTPYGVMGGTVPRGCYL